MRTLFLWSSSHSETLIHRPLFLFFSSRRRGFSSSSSLSSSASASSSSSSWRHHHGEESRNVKVSVWWDFENCSVPVGVNVFRVGQRIVGALRANGIKGPVTITAFGDVSQLSRSTQEALSSTGICLTHVPHSGKNSADRSLLLDLVCWVSQNPPPAHLFLISGDRDFANILHRLRMRNYNILLASTDCTSGVLCGAASIMWQWNGLVRGDSFTGKHFNHPPDGVYGSWYGHYKGPLDDLFLDAERSPLLQPEDSPEPGIDAKPRPIPKALVNRIRHIVNSYPDGVSLSELRTELGKSNITMDKDFFGYKKFSRFLLSMPNVLKIKRHPSGDGQPLVYSINGKTTEAMTSNSKTSRALDITDGHADHCPSSDGLVMFTKCSHQSPKADELLNSSSKSSSDGLMGHNLTEKLNGILPPPHQAVSDVCSPGPVEVVEKKVSASTPSQQHDSSGDVGFFRRIWRTWFHNKTGNHIEESGSVPGKFSSNGYHQDHDANFSSCTGSGKSQHKEEASQLVNHHLNLCSISRSVNESISDPRERTIRCSENNDDKSNLNAGFFKQFVGWLKFWKARKKHPNHDSVFANKSIKTDDPGKLSEGVSQICQQKNHDLFSKPYFWNDMESFFQTPKGAALISRSMTREQLAKELQNKGPLIVKALKVDHFPQLVDMLISEKKWVEECAPKTFPFKLKLPAKGTYSSTPHAHRSNELSSLFSNIPSQSNVWQLAEQQDKKQDERHILNETPINGNASRNKKPQNAEELKAWFKKIRNWKGGIEAEDFKRYFEREFKRDLDYDFYGFSCLESLFIELSADNGNSDKSSQKPSRCKSKAKADCKNLVVEILQKHPERFNIHPFKNLFYKRYGYDLDHQKLGFPTLMSLLQKIMPGLNAKATSILPSRKVKTDIGEDKQECEEISAYLSEKNLGKKGQSDDEAASSRKRDYYEPTIDQDSLWEELGPVTEAGHLSSGSEFAHNELGSALETGVCAHGLRSGCDGEGNQEMGDQMVLEKPLFSDEELSDSEGENVTNGVKGAGKNRSEEDSSLLKILNSWYGSKSGGGKDDMQNIDEIVDCARTRSNDSSKPSNSSAVFAEKMHHATSSRAKLRPHKNYSFVSDSARDDEEKLIDGILGSLRKSADTRM